MIESCYFASSEGQTIPFDKNNMVYSTNTIQTIQECDEILAGLNNSQTVIEARVAILQTGINELTAASAALPEEIADIEADIANLQTEIAAMPQGVSRVNKEIQLLDLQADRLRLYNRVNTLSGSRLTDKQFNLSTYNHRLEAITEYKAAVEAHKATLQSSANAA